MLDSDTIKIETSATAALAAPWRQNLLSIVPPFDSDQKWLWQEGECAEGIQVV